VGTPNSGFIMPTVIYADTTLVRNTPYRSTPDFLSLPEQGDSLQMMQLFQWVKQLVQPSADIHSAPAKSIDGIGADEINPTQQQIVSQQDLYHHHRPVLLLKSGQVVKPKTLTSLHNQGVPVVKYCALQQPDGSLHPLDHTTLRRVLAQHEHNEQFNSLAMNRMLDLQEKRNHRIDRTEQGGEPQAWQRHFKVLVISDSVALQEKVRHILEKADVLPQQIRPVMHLEALMYSYDKYRPTCLIFDEGTYRRFCHQGFDLIQFIQGMGGDCVENLVCLATDSYLAPRLSLEGIDYQVVMQPVHRQALMGAIEPVIASIKRTYSNTIGHTTPLKPSTYTPSLEWEDEETSPATR
jgi:hypothetical protein